MKILGHRYEVRYGDLSGEEYRGRCHTRKNVLEIGTDIAVSHREDTLLHEMLHAIDDVLSLGLDEQQVVRLAAGLHAVIIDNPDIFTMRMPDA